MMASKLVGRLASPVINTSVRLTAEESRSPLLKQPRHGQAWCGIKIRSSSFGMQLDCGLKPQPGCWPCQKPSKRVANWTDTSVSNTDLPITELPIFWQNISNLNTGILNSIYRFFIYT